MPSKPVEYRNPWIWVPSLYFAQGIPYVVVNSVAAVMYKRMGLSNTALALYTSWLTLPWVIKPLWSPLVDMFGTKRRWVVLFQFIMTLAMAAIIFAIPLPGFLQWTLLALLLIGFGSATHDIAADGFYMLALPEHQQAAFAGVRNTFWRFAMLASSGLMVMFAGYVEGHSGLPPTDLTVVAVNPGAPVEPSRGVVEKDGELRVVADPPVLAVPIGRLEKGEVEKLVEAAKAENVANGFCAAEVKASTAASQPPSWWKLHVAVPVTAYLRDHFGEASPQVDIAGNCASASFRLTAAPRPGQEVVVSVAQHHGDNNIKLVEGARFVFNANNWNQPAKAVFQIDPNLVARLPDGTIRGKGVEAVFSATSGKIPLAWSITFVVFAVVFGLLTLYHRLILPRPPSDGPSGAASSVSAAVSNFFGTFVEFFRKPGIVVVMAFLLLYRFGEAQLVKLVQPFLLDPRTVGGLGLTTSQVGTAYGTFGVASLLCGGLLGGYVISRQGLRFWLWPMIIILSLGGWVYLALAWFQPQSFALVCGAVAVEQFGYGFSFTAYILFMIKVCEGKYKTAHYAICTGFMALSMMIPGMISGWLQEILGYRHFFIWVLVSTVPAFLICALVKIDPSFGRKRAKPAEAPVPVASTAGEE